MPRQRNKPVGPYDLRTIKLPGGSELSALAQGFSRLSARDAGYMEAALVANERLLENTSNAYLVVDLAEPNGAIGRAMTEPQLFDKYKGDLERQLPGTHKKKLHHDITKAMGIPRGQGVDVGLPYEHTFQPNENLFITHTASARKVVPMRLATAPRTPAPRTPARALPAPAAANLETFSDAELEAIIAKLDKDMTPRRSSRR